MGNYFRVSTLPRSVMAANRSDTSRAEFGMHHVTVVPTNFDTDDEDEPAQRSSR